MTQEHNIDSVQIAHEFIGRATKEPPLLFVWGHGWGQDRHALAPLAEALPQVGLHLLLDFPGFGQSPAPNTVWGTEDYADAVAGLIRAHRGNAKVVWVGHSFGGRVGIQLAARHRDLIDGLFLIASAGLRPRRGPIEKVRLQAKIYTYKGLRRLSPLLGLDTEVLRAKFGSADYRSAGPMRKVFLKVISEDLSLVASTIQCPVSLIYGSSDTEAPPNIGERLEKLIPGSRLSILPGLDHYSILGLGRHLVLKRLMTFVEGL
jgi:pimeloyl-ACP methyl ester carboxylesterase